VSIFYQRKYLESVAIQIRTQESKRKIPNLGFRITIYKVLPAQGLALARQDLVNPKYPYFNETKFTYL
jgi:hypothetical protein